MQSGLGCLSVTCTCPSACLPACLFVCLSSWLFVMMHSCLPACHTLQLLKQCLASPSQTLPELLHSCHAGLHAKAKSASWNFQSTKASAAKSANRVRKSYTAVPTHAAEKVSLDYPADDLTAGPAASGSVAAAAARKGRAKLTDSRGGLQHGASPYVGTSAEQHKGGDGQMAAMPLSHSRLRSKVSLSCSSL